MPNEMHLTKLKQGVKAWNEWRAKHETEAIDLSEADLSNLNLTGVLLGGADLSEANLSGAHLRRADLRRADLRRADLRRADLSGADLRNAHLRDAHLRNAHLREADLHGAYLHGAHLHGADLSDAHLGDVSLSGAGLSEANLSGADLSGADLRFADLRGTNLIGANLDRAALTDARLWASQRSNWSIHNILCEAAYWDEDGQEPTHYGPGEFERRYAASTRMVLQYPGSMRPIEIAILPAFMQLLEDTHSGCALHLDSIQIAAGGATVTIGIDDTGSRSPDEHAARKKALEMAAQQAIRSQRELLQERTVREKIQAQLNLVYKEILAQMKGSV